MTDETAREVADAAVEFVEARQAARELRTKRAEVLGAEECAGENTCYLVDRLPQSEWCDRCKRAGLIHEEYRRAASRRGAALVKLKNIVTRRSEAQAAPPTPVR
jgi:hypothetical protein